MKKSCELQNEIFTLENDYNFSIVPFPNREQLTVEIADVEEHLARTIRGIFDLEQAAKVLVESYDTGARHSRGTTSPAAVKHWLIGDAIPALYEKHFKSQKFTLNSKQHWNDQSADCLNFAQCILEELKQSTSPGTIRDIVGDARREKKVEVSRK